MKLVYYAEKPLTEAKSAELEAKIREKLQLKSTDSLLIIRGGYFEVLEEK